jgi:hypothetical protein
VIPEHRSENADERGVAVEVREEVAAEIERNFERFRSEAGGERAREELGLEQRGDLGGRDEV